MEPVCHTQSLGRFAENFRDKRYAALTDTRIVNHLIGKETIGVYPLLTDNTSWFIVADFDETSAAKKSWEDECRTFLDACSAHDLPAYLERSRSGKGGHVWVFFDQPYPARKSRKLLLHLLEISGIISPFDKNSNYDRLFPNQDAHSGKGLGNLIALPLQHKALAVGNTGFIDPATMVMYPDQWNVVASIKRVPIEHLEKLFHAMLPDPDADVKQSSAVTNTLEIDLSNEIKLRRRQLTPSIVQFVRESLNFVNAEYVIKKRLGKSTWGIAPYHKNIE
ncbi:TOTE conflict system archaeo-eukaryotic primase domain-containing protein [Segetibacter sp. 3557_3]|uniref:TOTE conflict system archaeo-eukaryotic primase domain-containing protein n=1 Tax=Segetibacter sp. 3557_3 TaxID=2547429 RepID=UPI003978F7AA